MFSKDKRVLILVESPEKAKTINKIFKSEGYDNVVVKATIGHFTKIVDGSGYYNTGIHPEANFKMDLKIDESKKDNVQKLKEQIKYADLIYIASDLDREGECIGWTCVEFLNIPKSKYKRIRYNAINKAAIFKAIEEANDIDYNLVDAANARKCLDKGLGYSISQQVRLAGKGKSAGRCQTPGLEIIVDRENEILNFKPEKFVDLYLKFSKNKTEFKAKYQGTDKKPIKHLSNEKEVDSIFNDCKGNPFIIKDIEYKDRVNNPKPPFCTATFQQECANKLGLTVKQATDCAQKLFDAGKISYHRTDDECFEESFENDLKKFVKLHYKDYASGKVVKGKNDENSQEAHEALHVLDLNLTPEKLAEGGEFSDLHVKVYRIIYNRTIATALKPAITSETKYNIYNNDKHKFTLTSNELKYEGYRVVYNYKDEDEKSNDSDLVKETFKEGEELKNCSFEVKEDETKPKPRYKEATFLAELKDKGIGRPSTYHTILETIKSPDRGYCTVENKCLKPTERGMEFIKYIKDNFSDLLNIEYTKEMEKSLDLIASGKLHYIDFLKGYFNKLDESIAKVSPINNQNIDKICPQCGKPLRFKNGVFGPFYGCTGYPDCKYVEKIKKENNYINYNNQTKEDYKKWDNSKNYNKKKYKKK